MQQTLEQQAQAHNNDYVSLELLYRKATGSELVTDPYASVQQEVPITLSASVVIPAWNAKSTLAQCLIAIEQSSFNCKYPDLLEVVVVDDGSTDGTWQLLEQMHLGFRLKAVHQAHHSRAHTQNTGISFASGDVIISCDADMILTPFSIEELVKRHQLLDDVLLIGFRGDIQPNDPRIQPHVLVEHLPSFLPPYTHDMRLYYASTWPESMCRDSNHLKHMGHTRYIIMSDGSYWSLPGLVWGALFSLRRRDFEAMDGYDERFYGWGCEDTLVGIRAIAMHKYILPVYSAAGWHIAHGDRSRYKQRELASNSRLLHSILREPFAPDQRSWLPRASTRVRYHVERGPAAHRQPQMCAHLYDPFTHFLADSDQRGKYLHGLGRYEEAAAAFAEVRGTPEQEAWALFDQGKALRAAGRYAEALERLQDAAHRLPQSAWPLIELGIALAALGQFVPARQQVGQAGRLDPKNFWVNFLLHQPLHKHLNRAAAYARQGNHHLAIRDYEAALILEPGNALALLERARLQVALGQLQAARDIIPTIQNRAANRDIHSGAAYVSLAKIHLMLNELGPAMVALEEARRLNPRDQEVTMLMNDLHAAAARVYPLPLARKIVQQMQQIPGWLHEEEAELLIALVLRAVASSKGNTPVLVEVGCYCGRATVTMGLASRGLGRDDVRIVAIDEPSLGPAPDGRIPRDVLRSLCSTYGLEYMVTFAPEEEPALWEHTCHLLLIDGKHDYESVCGDVERYAPSLAPGGFLVFHDYGDDLFPDVRRYVNELLVSPGFEFVAQIGKLIALKYLPGEHQRSTSSATVLKKAATSVGPHTTWLYWEGNLPSYIALCCKTIFAHNENVVLLDRTAFGTLFKHDRDIDIDALSLPHKADFIRAYLLKHYGGLYIDADCIVMRNFSPVQAMVKQYEFVGYREPQGDVSCNFMASEPGGAVINAHYEIICATLRGHRRRGWMDLGSVPLNKTTADHPGKNLLLPTKTIMPIAWNESEQLFVPRSDEEHEQYFQHDALCYMLANQTIKNLPQANALYSMSEEQILNDDSFISFLFRKSLSNSKVR